MSKPQINKPVPKSEYVRSKAYREAVARLDCYRCGVAGFSNAAHSDSDGKGGRIKSSDTTCYPLCVDRPGIRGCHSLVGASGTLGKEARRELETLGAEATRCALILKSQDFGAEAARLRKVLVSVGLVK